MSTPLYCHMLIGPPGSGKSALAQQIQRLIPHSRIISTDQIRQDLYGDPTHQGPWADIEAKVKTQIRHTWAEGHSIIYDATNAKRVWRMGLLQSLAPSPPAWIGWHLITPLATCHQWNQQRSRTVPPTVIDSLYAALNRFPPHPAEGFAAVYALDPCQAPNTIAAKLARLDRSITNRANRTQHGDVQLHRYSALQDFDRLLHLISLLVKYPGLGDFHHSQPDILPNLVNQPAESISDDLSEICAALAHQCGSLYCDRAAVAQDLHWLEHNGFLSPTPVTALSLPPCPHQQVNPHPYSDWEPFQRLLVTLRFISHHPFCWNDDHPSSLDSLLQGMQQAGLLHGDRQAAIRKDIEQVLKPFGILPPFRQRRGYFIGSGILSEPQLLKVASLLQAQAKTIQDPIALSLVDTLGQRLQRSHHDLDTLYPVRAIAHRLIVDAAQLPADAIAHHPERLEAEIETGQLLELKTFAGAARFATETDDFFLAWPLQIVFHNIAWYLGYELASGPEKGLLRFQRLDRLFRGRPQPEQRSRTAQSRSLERLNRLQRACIGLYLGNSAQTQRQFLSRRPEIQAAATLCLELWFTDPVFAFISEGNQRFPKGQMTMSAKATSGLEKQDPLFSLPKSPDPRYPNRLRVTLPIWASQDVDLRRWILGFGPEVKVISPIDLRTQIHRIGSEVRALYDEAPSLSED